jgi:transposase
VVAMDGFGGYKTAATEVLPDATAVMDPFHVVARNPPDRARPGRERRTSITAHRYPVGRAGRVADEGRVAVIRG